MKTEYLLIILMLVSNAVLGQKKPKALAIEDEAFNNYFLNQDNIPKVKGKITNLTEAEISRINIDYSIVTPFEVLQVKKNCPLNADGSFELKLDYAFPYQQVWIIFDTLFYTGVYVTTDLFIELDASILKAQTDLSFNGPGVKYLGRDGALNEYTNNHLLFKRKKQLEIENQLQENKPVARTNYDAFIAKYDSLYSALSELDNEFIQQNPSDFSGLLINERQSNYFADLCVVHWGKQMPPELFEKIKNHQPCAVSNDGMLFYNYLFTYLNLITLRKRSAEKIPYDMVGAILQTISMFDSFFSQSKSDILKFGFSSKDPMEQKKKMETVLPHVKTEWCKSVINDEYKKIIEKLAEINKILNESKSIVSGNQLGEPVAELSFGARLYQVDAIKADSFIAVLKNSFKNKALFIDCWATWCAPCISEFPHSKKLSDACKDMPIEFVYLCTSNGSDIEKWKSKIAEYKLSGTHIFLEKSIESTLMGLFSVSGYPSYIFINKEGEYKPGWAKRPSELDKEKLAELIKE